MTVKEAISELEKYGNKDAELGVKFNFVNVDNEEYDIPGVLSFCGQENDDAKRYDVICSPSMRDFIEIEKRNRRKRTISDMLYDSDSVFIRINRDKGVITVLDDNADEVWKSRVENNSFHSRPDVPDIVKRLVEMI